MHFKSIIGSQYIKQWGSFLSSHDNKTELIRFLISRWKLQYTRIEIEVNVAYDIFCVNLQPNDELKRNDESELRPELSCNHEEADTRMLLNAKRISDTNIRNIVINTPDTDVFLIGIAASKKNNAKLYILNGTKIKERIIKIKKVKFIK